MDPTRLTLNLSSPVMVSLRHQILTDWGPVAPLPPGVSPRRADLGVEYVAYRLLGHYAQSLPGTRPLVEDGVLAPLAAAILLDDLVFDGPSDLEMIMDTVATWERTKRSWLDRVNTDPVVVLVGEAPVPSPWDVFGITTLAGEHAILVPRLAAERDHLGPLAAPFWDGARILEPVGSVVESMAVLESLTALWEPGQEDSAFCRADDALSAARAL